MIRTLSPALILAALAAGAAHAQGANKYNPPAPIVEPGPARMTAPGVRDRDLVIGRDGQNSGPGADTEIVHGATGASTVMTDSADGGNAGQPSRAAPQEGKGGGGGGR